MPKYKAAMQELVIQEIYVTVDADSVEEAKSLILRGAWDCYESGDTVRSFVMSPPEGGSCVIEVKTVDDSGVPNYKRWKMRTYTPLHSDVEFNFGEETLQDH